MSERKNEIGNRYGKLTVVAFSHTDKHGRCYWLCECMCGNKTTTEGSRLRSGNSRSCGCSRHETFLKEQATRIQYEIGKKYGRLEVIAFSYVDKNNKPRFLCKCGCGKETVVVGANLRNGGTKSCGCIRAEQLTARNVAGENHPMWGKKGEKSARWNGGVRRHEGYISVLNHGHPRRDSCGYVLEHILIMEQMLGRPLPDGAVVHHCNGDRADNRPYNLRLFLSSGEHTAYHHSIRREMVNATR